MLTWILEHKLAKIAKRAQDHVNNGIRSGNVVYSDLYAEAKSLAVKQGLSINVFHSRYPAMQQLHKLQECGWFSKNSISGIMAVIIPAALIIDAVLFRVWPYVQHFWRCLQ